MVCVLSCVTCSNPMNYSPPAYSLHGIFSGIEWRSFPPAEDPPNSKAWTQYRLHVLHWQVELCFFPLSHLEALNIQNKLIIICLLQIFQLFYDSSNQLRRSTVSKSFYKNNKALFVFFCYVEDCTDVQIMLVKLATSQYE